MTERNPVPSKQGEQVPPKTPIGPQHEETKNGEEPQNPTQDQHEDSRDTSMTNSNRSLLHRINIIRYSNVRRSKSVNRIWQERRFLNQRILRTPTKEELKRLRNRWARTPERLAKVDKTRKKILRPINSRRRETPMPNDKPFVYKDLTQLDTEYYVIPEFDPITEDYTVNAWLTRVEQCAALYGWTEKQIIQYMLPKLTGLAKTWCRDLDTIDHSWAEWKRKLRHQFPESDNYGELLTDMLHTRAHAGESLEAYYLEKMRKMKRCNIYGKDAADCLIYGIDDASLRAMARVAKLENPQSVLNFFRDIKRGKRVSVDFNKD